MFRNRNTQPDYLYRTPTNRELVEKHLRAADSCSRAGSDQGETIHVARATLHATLAVLDELRGVDRPDLGPR